MFLQAIPPRGVVAHLDLHCHFVAHDPIADGTLGDTQPFARGATVTLDRRQAGLRPDADAADADHRIAAAQHFLHAAEAAAAFAAVSRDNAGQVTQIEPDHRLLAAVKNRAHHVADFAIGNGIVVFHADDLEECAVLVEMHAGFMLALEGAHTHLVGTIHVVDVAAP